MKLKGDPCGPTSSETSVQSRNNQNMSLQHAIAESSWLFKKRSPDLCPCVKKMLYTSTRFSARASRSFLCLATNLFRQSAAFMNSTSGESTAAAEHTEEQQLAELLNQEAGLTSEIELQVIRNQLIDYSYVKGGAQVTAQKLQIVFQSKMPDQYCLGVAKLQKNDKAELKKVQEHWKTHTVWKFKAINLLNEKPAFIHTACRIAIDLRKSRAEKMLQSTAFPQAPVPTVTIADIAIEANAAVRPHGHSSQNHR